MAYCTLLGTFLRFLSTQFCILLVTLINLVSLPLLTPVLVPLLIYRYVLNKIGPIWRPKLGAMVTSRGALFSGDALFERKRPKVNIVIQCRLDARLDIERANTIAEERILSARRDDGSLMYPELRQFPTTLGGFYFWEWDDAFTIWNHVKHHHIELGPDYDDEDEPLAKFHEQLLQAEWPERKPIWEIWVVDVTKISKSSSSTSTKTTIFVKTHHSLSDGYSLLALFSRFAGVPYSSLENPLPAPASRPLWKSVLFFTIFPVRTAYELSCATVQRYSPFVSLPFLVPSSSQQKFPMRYICTKPISIEKVKAIKAHFGVTFTSVVNAALAGATRELMISKEGTTNTDARFPVLIPIPLPGHPEHALRNYMAGAFASLPIREEDPVKRLKLCDKDVADMKRSTFPLLNKVGLKLIGSLPVALIRLVSKNWLTSAWLTSFPAGKVELNVDSIPMWRIQFGVGLYAGPTGLGFSVITYQDELNVSVIGDGSIFSGSDMAEMTHYLEDQINILYSKIVPV